MSLWPAKEAKNVKVKLGKTDPVRSTGNPLGPSYWFFCGITLVKYHPLHLRDLCAQSGSYWVDEVGVCPQQEHSVISICYCIKYKNTFPGTYALLKLHSLEEHFTHQTELPLYLGEGGVRKAFVWLLIYLVIHAFTYYSQRYLHSCWAAIKFSTSFSKNSASQVSHYWENPFQKVVHQWTVCGYQTVQVRRQIIRELNASPL